MGDLIIGFSGTRDGMTPAQKETVTLLVRGLRPTEGHHGDCVGADAEFHDILIWESEAHVVIHPPIKPNYRAWCDAEIISGELRPERDYLARNKDIVHDSDLLIATPKNMLNRTGGTWFTIKYAMAVDSWVLVVRPDGSVNTN